MGRPKEGSSIPGDGIDIFKFCLEYISLSISPSSAMEVPWSAGMEYMSSVEVCGAVLRGGDWLAIIGSV